MSMPIIRSFAFQDYRRLRSGQQSHGNKRGNHTQRNAAEYNGRKNIPVRQDYGMEIDTPDDERDGYSENKTEHRARGSEQCRLTSEERAGKAGGGAESFHHCKVLAAVEDR